MRNRTLWSAAALAAVLSLAATAHAAAPEPSEMEGAGIGIAATTPVKVFELEREMVVKNWVLCFSAAVAEQLVRAREESVERAISAYKALQQAHSCGRVPELRVILQERLYASTAAGHDSRAYGALVSLSDKWASAYLVYGGLPEPQ